MKTSVKCLKRDSASSVDGPHGGSSHRSFTEIDVAIGWDVQGILPGEIARQGFNRLGIGESVPWL
jgi:hypothetical protein